MDFSHFNLKSGPHSESSGTFCAMEAYNKAYGYDHSDRAPDVDPGIQAAIRSWNDSLPTDEDRNRLLLPLLPLLKGTKGSDRLASRRAFMILDWDIRVRTPAFLRLARLTEHAENLENFPEIKSFSDLSKIEPLCVAADSAARSAADSAAYSAADSAAAYSAADSAAVLVADLAANSAAVLAADSAASAGLFGRLFGCSFGCLFDYQSRLYQAF